MASRDGGPHCGLSHNVCVLDSGTSQGKAVEVSKAMAHADNVMTTMVAVTTIRSGVTRCWQR